MNEDMILLESGDFIRTSELPLCEMVSGNPEENFYLALTYEENKMFQEACLDAENEIGDYLVYTVEQAILANALDMKVEIKESLGNTGDKFKKSMDKILKVFRMVINFVKQKLNNHIKNFSVKVEEEDGDKKVILYRDAVLKVGTITIDEEATYRVVNLKHLYGYMVQVQKAIEKKATAGSKAPYLDIDSITKNLEASDIDDSTPEIKEIGKFYHQCMTILYDTSYKAIKREKKKVDSETLKEYKKMSSLARHCLNINNVIKKI